jgi:NADPH-dependent glutamate synthase beta subunit-like oxidoreductase
MRPVYVDRLPPCNHACPAGENIQAWLAEAQAGRYREAWDIIVRDNPLPAVHGRVCYHPCEDACNRKEQTNLRTMHSTACCIDWSLMRRRSGKKLQHRLNCAKACWLSMTRRWTSRMQARWNW